jgi:F-type H+-transporting ATPase subunit alpha
MAELTINIADITAAIQKNLDGFNPDVSVGQVGRVLEVGDGIARVSGLPDATVNEILEFESGTLGLALNLDEDSIGAVVLGEVDDIEEGQTVKATGQILSVPVGDGLLGRVVNTMGEPIDGKGPLSNVQDRRVEVQAPGIIGRQPVGEPMQTGIKSIDSLIPVGRGQRELIIGDRKTGKTTVAIDAIMNQKGLGVKCIYVAIGQKASTVAQTVARLEAAGAMEYTVVVVAPASDPAPFKYLAPTPAAPWASTGWNTASTASSCTTTCPSRPRPTARCRSSSVARRGARPTPATCSTCTPVCSSVPPSCPTPSAPARSRPCRSSRPRPATSRPTSRRT